MSAAYEGSSKQRRVWRASKDAFERSESMGLFNTESYDDDDPMRMEEPADAPTRPARPQLTRRLLPRACCILLQVAVLAGLVALKLLDVQLPFGEGGGYHPAIRNSSEASPLAPLAPPTPPTVPTGGPPALPQTATLPPAAPPSAVSSALSYCPTWAPALGFGGASCALVLASVGSAYGTGKAAMGISAIGVEHPELVMKAIIPVVMAGVLGIYGLIIAVIISDGVRPFSGGAKGGSYSDYSLYTGCAHLAAGLSCGLSGLSAGIAIGIVGDAGVRSFALQRKVYVGMVLMLIFAEALGLYGLIVALLLAAKTSVDCAAPP